MASSTSMYAVPGSTLFSIADAIRSKAGTSSTMSVDAFAQSIIDIPSGIPDNLISAWMRVSTIADVTGLPVVGSYMFYYWRTLTSINAPNVSYIGKYGMGFTSSLQFANFPNVTYAGTSAFAYTGGSYAGSTSIYLDILQTVESENWFNACTGTYIDLYLRSVTSVPTVPGTLRCLSSMATVYVPSSLVTAFQSAQWWSNQACSYIGV